MDQFYKDQNNYFPYLAISKDINKFSFSNRGIDVIDNSTQGIYYTIDKYGYVILWDINKKLMATNLTLGFSIYEIACVQMYVEYHLGFVVSYFCVRVGRHVIQ